MKRVSSILTVDDDPILLDAVQLILEMEGYRVLTARNGVEALVVLGSEAVDAMLADVRMPHMDGHQLHERVRENPRWASIPFVLLTACEVRGEVRHGANAGADGCLTKPFAPDDLVAAVRWALGRTHQTVGCMPRDTAKKAG